MAIEGEILGVKHGKTGAFGGGRRMEKVGRCFWRRGREFYGGERGIVDRGAQSLVASFTDFLPLR